MIIRGVIDAVRVEQRNQVFLDVVTFANSVHKDVPLFGPYGIATVPRPGTRCILAPLGYDQEALIAIAVQTFTNPKVANAGDTSINSDGPLSLNSGGPMQVEGQGVTITSNGEELIEALDSFVTALTKLMFNAADMGATNATAIGMIKTEAITLKKALTTFKGI